MSDQEVRNIIISYFKSYDPERIGIFGSYIRGESNQQSDIDILIKFRKTLSLIHLIKIENELSEILGRKVDLVTEDSLKNERIRRNIFNELQVIYPL